MPRFTYYCTHCRKKYVHDRGYIFVWEDDKGSRLYYCNIDCYEAWDLERCKKVEPRDPQPKVDRRGAVHATRKKNAGSHLEFFDKHKMCNPKFWQRCYANECWGVKRHSILKARGQ